MIVTLDFTTCNMEGHIKLFDRLSDPSDRLRHRISHPSEEQTLAEPNLLCFLCIWVHGFSVCNPQFCKRTVMVPRIFPTNLVESKNTGYKPVEFTANRLTMPYIGAVVGVQSGMVLVRVTHGMITKGLTPLPPPY